VPNDFFEGGSDIDFTGDGAADQQNQLSGDITVTVADVLPNGVLAVRGEKRVRLNRGDEFIRFSGLVRPADITLDNNVLSTRVADARISYAGTGQVAAPSRQGWLQRFFVAVSPF
jgi:flagellar L-ring protein precursor FlgH